MINTVILVGRVGQNPSIKYYESGKTQSTFSLAVNRPKKSQDADDITDWFKIEIWGRFAEIAYEYIKKGSLIGIEGRLEFKKWKDANSGQEKEAFIVIASNFRLLSNKNDIEIPQAEKF